MTPHDTMNDLLRRAAGRGRATPQTTPAPETPTPAPIPPGNAGAGTQAPPRGKLDMNAIIRAITGRG